MSVQIILRNHSGGYLLPIVSIQNLNRYVGIKIMQHQAVSQQPGTAS